MWLLSQMDKNEIKVKIQFCGQSGHMSSAQ